MNETEAMNTTIEFGKFKNKSLEDVPSSYLDWLENQKWIDKYPSLLEAIGIVLRWRTKFNGHFE